jgi:hypothetical protein
MAASNLQVGIVIDTSKLRADRALVEAELKKVTKAMDDAVKAGDPAALRASSEAVSKLTNQYNRLTREIHEKTRATQADTRANREHNFSLREGVTELGHFLHASGIGIEGIKALKFGFAGLIGAEFIRGMKEAIGALNELNSTAKAIRADPQQLKAYETAFEKTGQKAELARTMIGGFNKVFDEAALKQIGTRGGTSGVNVLAGDADKLKNSLQDLQTVVRGGQQPQLDLSDPLRFLLGREVNVKNRAADMREAARRLLDPRLFPPDSPTAATLRSKLAESIYGGLTFEQAQPLLLQTAAGGPEQGPPPTRNQKKALDAWNKFSTESAESYQQLNISLGLAVVGAAEAASHLSNWKRLLAKMATGEISEIPAMPLPEAPAARSAAPTAPKTESHSSDSGGTDAYTYSPFSLGGHVRGGGSATSDSILARLSNGEFVINAGSARRLGGAFLQRLNRYASGGNVTGLDYDPSVTDFTGGAPDYRADRPQLSLHERRVLTDAFNKWRAGRGGRLLDVMAMAGGESDAEYFKRTGFHYGARPGETPLASGRDYARLTPLASGRDYARLTPLRIDPTQIPLYFSGGLVTAPPIRFAEGGSVGSVGSASATPVHLHIGGGTYPMSASSGVAAALVGAAKHSQMVSSGIKPSWYGR